MVYNKWLAPRSVLPKYLKWSISFGPHQWQLSNNNYCKNTNFKVVQLTWFRALQDRVLGLYQVDHICCTFREATIAILAGYHR